ncbi:MAG TPA: (2Fe-2S) ferredoxin domain-containing protein, partial [Thermodesulfobacteriota bacterium]|nr:(2Fe-2S) ferredoxin domain-containing protein [Thermodesulfobacteriota bacterium]
MPFKLKSVEEFIGLRNRLKKDCDPRVPTIVIPAGTCGQASGANDLIRVAKREILSRKLSERMRLRITGCNGFCQMEPLVVVEPAGTFYPKLGIAEMGRVIRAAAAGRTCDELFYVDPVTREKIEKKD